MPGYDYFDSAYFNDGQSKGTVYANYVAASRSSQVYSEIADTIVKVFRPKRALEIGCATGIIVKLLNDCGVEAHGIDVSKWAVDNCEHENVIQAGAEALPYPDDYFDFVYSVHALEHIPEPLAAAAFREMARVCPKGVQWHMLPIIGRGPYLGEKETVRTALKKDPTHNLLDELDWWLGEFDNVGLRDTGTGIHIRNESTILDLSDSQFIVSGAPLPTTTTRQIRERNLAVFRSYFERDRQAVRFLSLTAPWSDLTTKTDLIVHAGLSAEVDVLASDSMGLRLALLGEGFEAEAWFTAGKGQSRALLTEWTIRQGTFERTKLHTVLLGGCEPGTIAATITMRDVGGAVVFKA